MHIILMGILGVVVVLDEVELDVGLGTHLTKALGASSRCASILGGTFEFLYEVEHDVVLGTHLTKALGASSNASISS